MAYVGLLGSLALLIWLALRGVNIVFASLLCSLLIILTNDLPLACPNKLAKGRTKQLLVLARINSTLAFCWMWACRFAHT